MVELIMGLIIFVICFLIRYILFIWKNKKKKKKTKVKKNIIEINYLVTRFKLEEKVLNKKGIFAIISLLDAFIVSVTFTIVVLITDILILQMLLGLIIAMVLIFVTFEFYGKCLIKRFKK